MNTILNNWLTTDYHKQILEEYPDVCFITLAGSDLGEYKLNITDKIDCDIDYWTEKSFDVDSFYISYHYDDGTLLGHIDLYIHPLLGKFGNNIMMGYFNSINWRNLSPDKLVWLNDKYTKIWNYCLSVKDKVSKTGLKIMLEHYKGFIQTSIQDNTFWNKNNYRLICLCESLGLAPDDKEFKTRLKTAFYHPTDEQDIQHCKNEMTLLYDYITNLDFDYKTFTSEFYTTLKILFSEIEA